MKKCALQSCSYATSAFFKELNKIIKSCHKIIILMPRSCKNKISVIFPHLIPWLISKKNINKRFFFISRSLPKISSQEEDGHTPHSQFTGVAHFEPIPHDHDFCERVVINVSIHFCLFFP